MWLPERWAAATADLSAATTGASCGSPGGGVGGGIAAAAAAGDGTAADDVAAGAAAAVHGDLPNGGQSVRATGTKASAGETATSQSCCSAAGTDTGPSCATGSVPGFWGKCWFSSPDYPTEPAPAAESRQDCFRFSNDSVSSR